jgi:glycosyltransferase involved in cell wall biosynthesis
MINLPAGGTEILYDQLTKRIDLSQLNLIVSVCDRSLLSNTKPNVLWQHLSYDQENVLLLADLDFVRKLDAIVFVSHWQHEQFRKKFPLDETRCYVIQNATEAFEAINKPQNKIKLIYTSTPWRGLDILVEVLKHLERDVDVEIYSGTSIYGPQFHKSMEDKFHNLYDEINRLNIKRIEYATNKEIRKSLESSHILAYPSTFEETSCLSAIEALSAGCKVVTTNYGALYETCGVWADYVPISQDLVKRYTKQLRYCIDHYWDNYNERELQYEHYKKFWSWEKRLGQWKTMIKEINHGK